MTFKMCVKSKIKIGTNKVQENYEDLILFRNLLVVNKIHRYFFK
jgi:hypothetical protein